MAGIYSQLDVSDESQQKGNRVRGYGGKEKREARLTGETSSDLQVLRNMRWRSTCLGPPSASRT